MPEDAPRRVALSRRSFLASAGAVSIAVSFVGSRVGRASAGATTDADGAFRPNAWVTIDGGGRVTIMSAPAEMGQGIMTGLPACLAEELDADWSRVRVVQSPARPEIFGNPALRMEMSTYGDYSTQGYYERVRLVGAQARKVLLLNAARVLRVPVAELSTRSGMIVHARSGRRMSYGRIARIARVPEPLPEVTTADLKPRSEWRLIGRALPRVDIPGKVDGSAVYGIDVQRPGMLYGAILYPPVVHERPLTIDDADAKAVPGLVRIVPCAGFVGVVAETVEAAQRGRSALQVSWTATAEARRYDTGVVPEDYRRIAADLGAAGVEMSRRGDAAAAIARSPRVLSREFLCDHVAHTAMEPMNATALVDGDRVEVWLSTQSPSAAMEQAAKAAGTTPDRVTIHSMLIGGGFGRLSDDADAPYEAVLLAKNVPGRPVKLIRSREDDFLNDKFRPLAAQRIDVGLDADGNVQGWRHRIVSASHFARFNPKLYEQLHGQDFVAGLGGDVLYGWPDHLAQFVRAERGWDVGPWRGVSFGYANFAIESVIDEIADLQKSDPVELRLRLLAQQPRAAQVLRTAGAMAGWERARPPGRALGCAFASMSKSYAAAVLEVSLERVSGEIRVHEAWIAVDAGVIVNPNSVTAQLEGATIMGLGPALYEQIDVRNGELAQSNFGAYRPPRMSQAPEAVHVSLIRSDEPPGGVGEIGIALVAPAIGNAVARLTGKWPRSLPMSPERIRTLLQ